jgi:predicted acetylornithine/succinylornithine family transaminase
MTPTIVTPPVSPAVAGDPLTGTSATGATASIAVPQTPIVGTYKRQAPLFVRGEGVHMFDETGKRYLDFVAGIAVTALGHNDAGVRAAMQEAMDTGLIHTSNLYRTAPGEALARWLVEHSFASSVFFSNSGAEANEGAFKFARRWARTQNAPGKHEIVALRGAFHGRLPGTLAATDRPAYRLPFRPLMGGVSIVERDLDELRIVLDAETTAAVIVEPIQGEGGVRVVDHDFLRGLRTLTRERNILLILDEIQCGLGRTGSLFAYEQVGIVPDMMTLAKPLAGGLPMGAILVNSEVAAVMQPGDHGTTFGGGPFVAHVALHVVERLAAPELLAHVRETGAWLGEQLQGIAERTGRVRAIRGTGFMWGIDVHESAGAIVARAFERGLLLVTAGEHTLRLLPPLVMTREQLAEGLAIIEACIANT